MEAPLSSRNNISSIDGEEVSSSGLKMYELTKQVDGVIALV